MAFSKKELFSLLPQLVSERARALLHPARVEIFLFLAEHGETIFDDLHKLIPLAQPTLSQHLRHLVRHKLLFVREKSPHTYYSLNPHESSILMLVLEVFVQRCGELGVRASDLDRTGEDFAATDEEE